jgi:hypothetical protein
MAYRSKRKHRMPAAGCRGRHVSLSDVVVVAVVVVVVVIMMVIW